MRIAEPVSPSSAPCYVHGTRSNEKRTSAKHFVTAQTTSTQPNNARQRSCTFPHGCIELLANLYVSYATLAAQYREIMTGSFRDDTAQIRRRVCAVSANMQVDSTGCLLSGLRESTGFEGHGMHTVSSPQTHEHSRSLRCRNSNVKLSVDTATTTSFSTRCAQLPFHSAVRQHFRF